LTKRFAILQLLVACLMVSAWYMGWVDRMMDNDQTYIVELIVVISLIAVHIGPRNPSLMKWMSDFMPLLGMVGTVIGFLLAFSGEVNPTNMMDPALFKEMVGRMLAGLGTALSTTLVGLLCFIWLEISGRCLIK
jgi:hypothetical protein